MKKQLSIPYFPSGLRYITPLLALGGIYIIILDHPAWGVLMLLLAILILTTKYVTAIDLGKKQCHDYLLILGIEMNEEVQYFTQLEKIIITKGSYAQTINTRSQSRQLDWEDYTGTLVHDRGHVDLLTRNSKEDLLKALKELSVSLRVPVEDVTSARSYWINMEEI